MQYLYLKFRSKQIYRIIQDAGIGLLIIVLVVLAGIFFKILKGLSEINIEYQIALILLLLLLIHLQRKDLVFVRSIFKKWQVKEILILEYSIICLPIILFLTAFNSYISFSLILIPIIFGISIPLQINSYKFKNKLEFNFIPNQLFEFKSFARRKSILIIIAFCLSLFCFLHISIFILSSLIWASIVISVFDHKEPKEYIYKRGFLVQKISLNNLLLFLLLLPMLVIGIFFLTEYLWLILYVYLSLSILMTLAIAYKYSTYHPLNLLYKNASLQALMIAFFILPGFGIANLMLMTYYLLKANANINRLYD